MKISKYQQAMDQVNLSSEADQRISAAIQAASQEQKVVPMSGGRAKKSAFRFGRSAVIAAVLAGLLIVSAMAAANISRIVFWARPTQKSLYLGGYGNITGWLDIFFEQTTDETLELGVWEPGAVPEGYEKVGTFDNDEIGYHRDNWGTAAGEIFYFSYQLSHPADSDLTVHTFLDPDLVIEDGEVTINGSPGWYIVNNDYDDGDIWANLYWTNPEAGIGFTIFSCDLSLDELIAIAESVEPQ